MFENVDLVFIDEDILNNLGAVCINSESFVHRKYLLKAEEKNRLSILLKNLALLYQKKDQSNEAIKYYNRYFSKIVILVKFDYALYYKNCEWSQASQDLLTNEITDIASLYNLQARVELKLGNTKKALDATRRASQLTDQKCA